MTVVDISGALISCARDSFCYGTSVIIFCNLYTEVSAAAVKKDLDLPFGYPESDYFSKLLFSKLFCKNKIFIIFLFSSIEIS